MAEKIVDKVVGLEIGADDYLTKPFSMRELLARAETVDNNTFPLARPLFLYSDAKIMQEKPQVAAYINFFLSYVNTECWDWRSSCARSNR